MEKYAQIFTFDEFNQIRDGLGRIVCTSGGFDPLHPGHASCIIESKQYGDTLVVVVNGDNFLQRKKGKAFMDLQTRCHLVASLREVDYVIPFEIEDDPTVCQALRLLRPDVFTKGGDRVDNTNIPEWQVCQELGIELVSQVGRPKLWSSSDFLKEWGEFWLERGDARPRQAGQEPTAHLPGGESQPGNSPRQRRQAPSHASAARPESGFGPGA
jgi:D-beta-D-heptose 7-phosphate kinase/D-beta-D-heptose 1-phosphate adenosyltransferase